MDKQEFINKIKDGAVSAMNKYGILASLTIAQAILESGWGESELTKAANNLFGIKRWGYPDFVEMPTTEYRNGEPAQEKAEFRKYSSWDYSIADNTAFLLQNNRYKNLIGVKNYRQACTLIQQDRYATDPNYANLLIQIIEENELQKYDYTTPLNPVIASMQLLCNSLGIKDYNGSALVVDGVPGAFTSSAIAKLPLTLKALLNLC
jgi:flagellum-specific peptidoglycan hydrolase FlgJ